MTPRQSGKSLALTSLSKRHLLMPFHRSESSPLLSLPGSATLSLPLGIPVLTSISCNFSSTMLTVVEEHGPSLLYVLFSKLNPSNRVKVNNLLFKLSLLRMSDFKQHVIALLDAMQALYDKIDDKQGSPPAR
mmetsp:Transcript_35400/g.40988  ORF Transcript_35400/g.40988 Transcript_35400/m.40988 type:complete len:132 (-) Transcript_35400:102-497(-)